MTLCILGFEPVTFLLWDNSHCVVRGCTRKSWILSGCLTYVLRGVCYSNPRNNGSLPLVWVVDKDFYIKAVNSATLNKLFPQRLKAFYCKSLWTKHLPDVAYYLYFCALYATLTEHVLRRAQHPECYDLVFLVWSGSLAGPSRLLLHFNEQITVELHLCCSWRLFLPHFYLQTSPDSMLKQSRLWVTRSVKISSEARNETCRSPSPAHTVCRQTIRAVIGHTHHSLHTKGVLESWIELNMQVLGGKHASSSQKGPWSEPGEFPASWGL